MTSRLPLVDWRRSNDANVVRSGGEEEEEGAKGRKRRVVRAVRSPDAGGAASRKAQQRTPCLPRVCRYCVVWGVMCV